VGNYPNIDVTLLSYVNLDDVVANWRPVRRAIGSEGSGAPLANDPQAMRGSLPTEATCVSPSFRRGDPVTGLRVLVNEADIDLVVARTRGRTGLMQALLGSVASRILNEVPSDVLVVPSRLR
jgi:nucleotide-binding universal stress UspA family protein